MATKRRTSKKHRIIRTQRQRIAWTNTSRVSDNEVIAAIKFVAREVDLDRAVIHFKRHGRAWRWGMAYKGIPSIANLNGLQPHEWNYLITVSDHGVLASVVNTLAHEGKHIEQYKRGQNGSEPPCRAFGAWMEERWLAASPSPDGACPCSTA